MDAREHRCWDGSVQPCGRAMDQGSRGQNPNLLTITLPDPAGYQDGDRVEVVDVDETCSFNQITLVATNATINLQVNHQYVMNTDGLSVTFDLDKAHNNWVLV